MKIVVLDGYALNPGDLSWEGIAAFGELTVYDRTPAEDTIARIGDARIIFTNKTVIDRQVLDACPDIAFIGVLATGYNVVDVKTAREKGIVVCNVPQYSTPAVAQFTIGLILELAAHMGAHSTSVAQGDWCRSKDFCYWNYPLIELQGKTLGIIGFGSIGQAVARIAEAMGMKVLTFSRTIHSERETAGCHYTDLDTLFAKSDVISLHCPLFPETQEIICKKNIEKMKDGVWIINTARGGCVAEADLTEALNSGKVGAAALDVVSTEPMNPDNPLLQAKNILITPHIAWASKEARCRLMQIATENLKKFLIGEPQNAVN